MVVEEVAAAAIPPAAAVIPTRALATAGSCFFKVGMRGSRVATAMTNPVTAPTITEDFIRELRRCGNGRALRGNRRTAGERGAHARHARALTHDRTRTRAFALPAYEGPDTFSRYEVSTSRTKRARESFNVELR